MGTTARDSNLDDAELALVRSKYQEVSNVPQLLRWLASRHPEMVSFDMMWVLMDAFALRLGDVGCIDGWWPPDGEAEIPDERLHRFIAPAIEAARSTWEN